MAQWFYVKDGQQVGPVETARMMQMLTSGEVTAADLVWRDGMANWVAAGSVSELRQPVATPAYMAPAPAASNFAPMPYGGTNPIPGYYGAPPGAQPPSKLGLASFGIGILVCVTEFGSIVYATAQVMQKNRSSPNDPGMIVAGLFMIGGLLLALLGVILGFIGISQSQKRTFAILGTIINGGVLLLVAALMVIGLAKR